MKRRPEPESSIRLGRGRRLSWEAAAGVWRAVVSRNPAADWTRGRVLAMGFTVLLLVWGVGRVVDVVARGPGAGSALPNPLIEAAQAGTGGDPTAAGPTRTAERLRSDLFKVPKPKKKDTRKEPKTNPVELLRLLELQGLLGGDQPRAIVFYKQTKQTVTVSVGDDLGEFEVMEIRERCMVLKWRDELFELSL